MKKNIAIYILIAAIVSLLPFAAKTGRAYTVYPDDPYWSADSRTENSGGTAAISTENPRSGNASLKLTVGGDDDPYDDWAFYTRTTDSTNGWGLLSDITTLSFDWYRATDFDWYTDPDKGEETYLSWDPWNLQTPVLRLLITDGTYQYELVWEQYYTDSSGLKLSEWVTEDLISQNFWCYIAGVGYTLETGDTIANYGDNPSDIILAQTLSEWLTYFSSGAYVYGISVGVGSNWPGEYTGYVDNIVLSFSTGDILNDNFEVPVPEPTTWLLLAVGILMLFIFKRRKPEKA